MIGNLFSTAGNLLATTCTLANTGLTAINSGVNQVSEGLLSLTEQSMEQKLTGNTSNRISLNRQTKGNKLGILVLEPLTAQQTQEVLNTISEYHDLSEDTVIMTITTNHSKVLVDYLDNTIIYMKDKNNNLSKLIDECEALWIHSKETLITEKICNYALSKNINVYQ